MLGRTCYEPALELVWARLVRTRHVAVSKLSYDLAYLLSDCYEPVINL